MARLNDDDYYDEPKKDDELLVTPPPQVGPPPPAAATTGPSDEDRLRADYQSKFGRAPDAQELAGGLYDAQHYGYAGLERNLDARASNQPTREVSKTQPAPAQAWNQAPSGPSQGMFPDWYRELMTRNLAMQEQQQAQNKGRSDSLYGFLNSRAQQGLNVTAQDPIIRQQTDAYRAEQERAKRNFLSDAAERGGSLSNPRGEQRIAAERVGQNVSGFQAQLLQRELMARRDEIAQALTQQGAMLSGDQQRSLAEQLAALDQAIKEASIGLGQGQLALGNRSLDTSNDQFMRELALRQWQLGDQSDLNWAQL